MNFEVAPEYEARLAEILAVEDEDTMCLSEGVKKTHKAAVTASSASGGTAGFDPSTKMHHEAIFAPTGSVLSRTPLSPTTAPLLVSPSPVTPAGRIRSTGVMGAAARAKLALTGRFGEESTTKPKQTPTSTNITARKSKEHSQPCEDNAEKPLYKTLRVCSMQP